MNKNYDEHYMYAEIFINTINDSVYYGSNGSAIRSLLYGSWLEKPNKNEKTFSSTTYKYETDSRTLFFVINYCDDYYHGDTDFMEGKTNGFSEKMTILTHALTQLKAIQRQIEKEEWKDLVEFYSRVYPYKSSKVEAIMKDDYFIWYMWESVEQLEAYFKRVKLGGHQYDTN